MSRAPTLLVIAKAPVSGEVKTRLCPPLSPAAAADVAAAALVDTLRTVAAAARLVGSWPPVVALTGAMDEARCRDEVMSALREWEIIAQRGATLGDRLAGAHADCAVRRPGAGIVQLGMDTPQVEAQHLLHAAITVREHDAALGIAEDGGWWALALAEPRHACVLRTIPMSRPDTGQRTSRALTSLGLEVVALPVLRDVDCWSDAVAVAGQVPDSAFRRAVRAAEPSPVR